MTFCIRKKPTENVLSCSAALVLLAVKHNCLTSSTPASSQGRVYFYIAIKMVF